MASAAAISSSISSRSLLSRDSKAALIASIRHPEPSIATPAASGGPRPRRMLARPCCAVEPTKRNDSVVPSAAVAGAANAAVGEEATAPSAAVDYEELNKALENASPLEIMDRALDMFGNEIAIAFSGAEDVALIEYAKLTGRPFRVFSLDTGRLNPETYRFFDAVEKHYDIHIEYTFPDAGEVQALVRSKGLFSFYEDGHQECCRVRKVRPLRRMLKGLRAWVTGQRKDQSPGTRANIPLVQVDPVFEGVDGLGSLIKWNPVADVEGKDIWNFLRTMNVPVNSLHSQGYVSIGCEPCTRPVLPGQHEREGRWWWEDATAKECGLHKGNLKQDEAGKLGANGNGVAAANGVDGTVDIFETQAIVNLSRPGIENLLKLEKRQEPWLVVLYAPWCRFCQGMEVSYMELAEKLVGSGIKVGKFRADGDQKPFAQKELQLGSFPTILFFPKNTSRPIKYPSEKRDVDSLLAFINALR
ncbi:hypothetical protein C4D60_Mb02t14700 [Musa balbisiana]|uniref:Adenosine 5'-phosphosulfate reductase n=1 Tax=Musa balbisiana TaxID=52838 RepID=A0A4S8IAQ5_MUSBA|nr:hypothetical protein C4D60_Mb02t14700 [Musa balbisiana]